MGMSVEEYKRLLDKNISQKSVTRQLQGKINRDLGKNFEERVESICEDYKLSKLAIIEKTPEPMKIIRHIENGHFETVFTKFAQPDFKGTINGGKTIVFDAKFTESNKITYQVLSDNQRENLIAYHEMGAMAFILVGFADYSIYTVNIDTWKNMKEIFGRKYILQQELNELGVLARRKKNGIIDFLNIC